MTLLALTALAHLAVAQVDAPPPPPPVDSPALQPGPSAAPLLPAEVMPAPNPARRARLLIERDTLLRERPTVTFPIVAMAVSGGAAVVGLYYLFSYGLPAMRSLAAGASYSPGLDILSIVWVCVFAALHITGGVLGSVLLPAAIKKRAETDARVREINAELGAYRGPF